MSFKDKVEEKKMRRMARPPELTVKDWISLYDLLRSAKAQDSEAMYEDFASVLLTTLSVEHHPELYRPTETN